MAIDAARVSRRLNADVTIAYRRRREDMPADDEEIEDAIADGLRAVDGITRLAETGPANRE